MGVCAIINTFYGLFPDVWRGDVLGPAVCGVLGEVGPT